MPDHKILFLPGKQTAYFEEGITLRDAALQLGIIVESSCAGIGTCAKCKVNAKEGVSPPAKVEQELLTPRELAQGVRLSCQAELVGDCLCLVPEESRSLGTQILTEGRRGTFALEPDIRKIYLKIPEPVLGEKYFDLERFMLALRAAAGASVSGYELNVVRTLPKVVRETGFAVTAIVDRDKVLGVEGGDTGDKLYGAAVDIGTTTIVVKLLDLNSGQVVGIASDLNAQRPYGADVISRVNYIVEHSGGLELLHRLITRQMGELISQACEKAEIGTDDVYKLTVVGNTIMQHIALNVDPRSVAFAPYTPAIQGPVTVRARDLGVKINSCGVAYFLPNLASFVGSDITAVLTVLDLDSRDSVQLAVDIGTNGEMVLGSKERLVCCSSPAGPAWEGAYIVYGMRAARGAIERAEIVEGDLQLRTIADAEPIGICGSGLLDLVCEFLRAGMIDKSGRILNVGEMDSRVSRRLKFRVVHRQNGSNDITVARVGDENSVMLMQKDIREVQLAKAAIATGIKILMKELNVDQNEIATVSIAGAFGNHVRGLDATDAGLLPPVADEKIRFVGNAAVAGAEAVLLSREAREKAERLSRFVDYVEISGRGDFQDIFVDSMHFPLGSREPR